MIGDDGMNGAVGRRRSIHPIPDSALDDDIAVVGKKGKGKTYTARGLVERLLTLQRRVIVLDPLSTWWGLRTTADGKSPAFPIAVFGGPHGDLPIDDRVGRPLARVLAETHLSAILDMGDMKRAEQNRLVGDFLDELRAANRRPLTIVLEEADLFAPQQPTGDDSARVLGAVDWIARRGRSRGFKLISITQRPAKLNKDVLTQLSVLVALGLPSPHDRKAIEAWVEGNADKSEAKAVTSSLANLSVGEGWVWAPDHQILERVRFPRNQTLDTSATPKAGNEPVRAQTLADVDLSPVREALARNQEPVAAHPAADAEKALREAERRGYERGLAEGRRLGRSSMAQEIAEAVRKAGEEIHFALDNVAAVAAIGGDALSTAAPKGEPAAVERRRPAPAPQVVPVPVPEPAPAGGGGAGRMSPTTKRVLAVLEAAFPASLTFKAAALRAGASRRSSAFRIYERELLQSGRVVEENGRLRANRSNGESMADPIALFASKLAPSHGRMLRAISDAGGALTREEVADRAGVSRTSSGLAAGLAELVAMALVEKENGGRYRLAAELVEKD